MDKHGRLGDGGSFPGDVVIRHGVWEKGLTIEDIASDLRSGDVIFKGANAVNPEAKQAAILIGSPTGGTISRCLQAVIGRWYRQRKVQRKWQFKYRIRGCGCFLGHFRGITPSSIGN